MIHSYLRTLLLYAVLVCAIRLMGKRQIGQLEPSEFVVTMLVANLAAVPMQDGAIPLYSGLVPILTVLGAELALSGLVMASVGLRRLCCGKPVILIDNGRLLQQNLRRTRVTLDELTGQLRKKDILDIRSVRYAILETDGNLSVFPWPKPGESGPLLPVTVVEDGYVSRENLRRAGHSGQWLQDQLRSRGTTLRDTLLLTVDPEGTVVHLRKERP